MWLSLNIHGLLLNCLSSLYSFSKDCWDRPLKSMIRCNRFGIHYLFNDIPFSLLFILIPSIVLYEHSRLVYLTLYMIWLH